MGKEQSIAPKENIISIPFFPVLETIFMVTKNAKWMVLETRKNYK